MTGLAFNTAFSAPYGEVATLSPLVRRVLAPNPGPFTFRGTGVYIAGGREVAVIDPGPLMAPHLEALKCALEGLTVTHILITHTHADHSPAARAVKDWTGAVVCASAQPAKDEGEPVEEGFDRNFVADRTVRVPTVGSSRSSVVSRRR